MFSFGNIGTNTVLSPDEIIPIVIDIPPALPSRVNTQPEIPPVNQLFIDQPSTSSDRVERLRRTRSRDERQRTTNQPYDVDQARARDIDNHGAQMSEQPTRQPPSSEESTQPHWARPRAPDGKFLKTKK